MPQNKVNTGVAQGLPGQKASLNPVVYYPNNLMVEGDKVCAGQFAWPGSLEILAKGEGAANKKPLGLVERLLIYPNYDPTKPGSLKIAEMEPVSVAVKGDFWVVSSTPANKGHKVFALLDGSGIATGTEGATVPGAIETPWVVMTSGAAGEPIIISNWSI